MVIYLFRESTKPNICIEERFVFNMTTIEWFEEIRYLYILMILTKIKCASSLSFFLLIVKQLCSTFTRVTILVYAFSNHSFVVSSKRMSSIIRTIQSCRLALIETCFPDGAFRRFAVIIWFSAPSPYDKSFSSATWNILNIRFLCLMFSFKNDVSSSIDLIVIFIWLLFALWKNSNQVHI